MKIAAIVEGDGEVAALPVLMRRVAAWRSPQTRVEIVSPPIRVRRDRFLNRDEEFRRQLLLAAAKCGTGGWILVVLDADDDCPAELGPKLVLRALDIVPHRAVSVVLANREYEAWFIAAAASLGLAAPDGDGSDAEAPRDAKGWIRARMSHYEVLTDQPALSARMDLDQAHRGSRSFRKLCSEWDKHVGA